MTRDRTRTDAAKLRTRTRRGERRRKSALLFLAMLAPAPDAPGKLRPIR